MWVLFCTLVLGKVDEQSTHHALSIYKAWEHKMEGQDYKANNTETEPIPTLGIQAYYLFTEHPEGGNLWRDKTPKPLGHLWSLQVCVEKASPLIWVVLALSLFVYCRWITFVLEHTWSLQDPCHPRPTNINSEIYVSILTLLFHLEFKSRRIFR